MDMQRLMLKLRTASEMMGWRMNDVALEGIALRLQEFGQERAERAIARCVDECDKLNVRNILERMPQTLPPKRTIRPAIAGPAQPIVTERIASKPMAAARRAVNLKHVQDSVPQAIKELAARRNVT